MDRGEPSPTRRKLKFAPKASPNRKPKLPASNTDFGEQQHEDDNTQAQALLHRWNENHARREPKERKSSVQVAFGPGDSSSPPLRTHGVSKGVNSGRISGSGSKDVSNEQSAFTRSATAIVDKSGTCMVYATEDRTKSPASKNKRDYKEPWDYQHSNYPTTLPLRRPYSGDPEILDEEEFGEAATNKEYDENTVNSAEELGLKENREQQRMLLFKLPSTLPLINQSVSRKGKEKVGTSTTSTGSTKGTPTEGLPQGHMGKMLIYKSGAIKLKLGEILFDVSPGSNATFAQDAVAINTAQKHCCVLGGIDKVAVVTPDIDSVEF